jgi:ligand-binding sensor domain-containing protein
LTTADGLPENWLRDVLATDDGLWVATERSGLCYLKKGRAPRTFTRAADGLPSDSVSSLALYRGKVYAGGEAGLAVFDGERWEVLDIIEKVVMRDVLLAVDTARDELWAEAMHVGGGLVKFDGERWSFFGGDGKGLVNNVTAVAFQGGTLWLGTVGSGIYRIAGGAWGFVRSGDGLRGDGDGPRRRKNVWMGPSPRRAPARWHGWAARGGLAASGSGCRQDLLVRTTATFNSGEDAAVRPIPLADGGESLQIGRIRADVGREAVWVATTRGLYELRRQ